ncbi:hypothetical protein T492DRAFT_1035078 [Pavlovales sp. CCMP2436]|nr:hypothetical protein T492DRAFT_1035078 [Pavlovales sp. CCMP2436]
MPSSACVILLGAALARGALHSPQSTHSVVISESAKAGDGGAGGTVSAAAGWCGVAASPAANVVGCGLGFWLGELVGVGVRMAEAG